MLSAQQRIQTPRLTASLNQRETVLNKLNEKADAGRIDKARLRIFTFNDTVVIVYLAVDGHDVTVSDIETFAIRLRAFMMHSFGNRLLFRGSISVLRGIYSKSILVRLPRSSFSVRPKRPPTYNTRFSCVMDE
jgi:hypothetical protein